MWQWPRASARVVHEVIALAERKKARAQPPTPPVPFDLARIRVAQLLRVEKWPDKRIELRVLTSVDRSGSPRLRPVERTGFVEKVARRVHRAGKLRLFRLWKLFGKSGDEVALPLAPRLLAERLASLRRMRRL